MRIITKWSIQYHPFIEKRIVKMGALDNFEPTKIMPSDEVELRREYAKCIDARMKFYDPTFKMNSVHLASIITTPLDSLDQIRRMSLMGSFLGSLPPLLKRCKLIFQSI